MSQQPHQASNDSETLGPVACNIIHDVNNGLTAVMASASMASQKSDNPEIKRYMDTIHSVSLRISVQIREALSAARNARTERLRPLNATYFFNTACDMAKMFISHKNTVHTQCDIAPGTHIIGSEADLQNTLINLVVNAAHSMDGFQHGRPRPIEISAITHCNTFIITVEDHGVGISREQLRQVMTPFYTTKDNGSGIGLPSVEACVKAHDGIMDIDSESGVGTRITLIFPIAIDVQQKPEPVIAGQEQNWRHQ